MCPSAENEDVSYM